MYVNRMPPQPGPPATQSLGILSFSAFCFTFGILSVSAPATHRRSYVRYLFSFCVGPVKANLTNHLEQCLSRTRLQATAYLIHSRVVST
jgi:hypothetical protein